MPHPTYADFGDRLVASTIDGVVWVAWLVVAVFLPWPESLPGIVRLSLWLAVPLLAEPALVFARRATIGQSARGLRVEASPGRAFPGLLALLARHCVKLALLGFSALYVPFAPRYEAIHDRLFGTVVVHVGASQPSIPPRASRGSLRRFLFAVIWVIAANIAMVFLLGVVLAVFFPDLLDETGDEATVVEAAMNLVVLVGEVLVLALAFSGRLPGTRSPAQEKTS